MRGADQPDRRRRAVLLVVGVQDEQHVQRLDQVGVLLVGLGREAERHPQEVLDQPAGVVRVEERLADRLLVGVGRDGRQLRQQAQRGDLHLLLVERVQRVLVEGRQGADRRGEHRHRVRVAREALEELLEVLVQQGVPADPLVELAQLVGGRQLAVDQQVGDLEEAGVLGQLVDRVPAVAQDPGVTVDVGDRRRARGRVHEADVEGDLAGRRQQLARVEAVGALGRLDDGQGQFSTGVAQGYICLAHQRRTLLRPGAARRRARGAPDAPSLRRRQGWVIERTSRASSSCCSVSLPCST